MTMYVDDQGRPDPNGNWKLVDGNRVLREGGSVRFNIAMLDNAHSPVFLTDIAAATAAVARARYIHDLSHAHLGDNAPAFCAEDEAKVIADANAANAAASARLAALDAAADTAAQLANDARDRMIADLTNRGGR